MPDEEEPEEPDDVDVDVDDELVDDAGLPDVEDVDVEVTGFPLVDPDDDVDEDDEEESPSEEHAETQRAAITPAIPAKRSMSGLYASPLYTFRGDTITPCNLMAPGSLFRDPSTW